MKKLPKFNWSRLTVTHPDAYSNEELVEYMLNFGSLTNQKFEEAAKIQSELSKRRKEYKFQTQKIREANLRNTAMLTARRKVIESQLKYLGAFPARPDSRTERLYAGFKLNTPDGVAICIVNKIDIRGEYIWYHVTGTILGDAGEVQTKKFQIGTDALDDKGYDFITFMFNPTKAMDKRYGWLTWNFDIIFSSDYPEVITRTDIDQLNTTPVRPVAKKKAK